MNTQRRSVRKAVRLQQRAARRAGERLLFAPSSARRLTPHPSRAHLLALPLLQLVGVSSLCVCVRLCVCVCVCVCVERTRRRVLFQATTDLFTFARLCLHPTAQHASGSLLAVHIQNVERSYSKCGAVNCLACHHWPVRQRDPAPVAVHDARAGGYVLWAMGAPAPVVPVLLIPASAMERSRRARV